MESLNLLIPMFFITAFFYSLAGFGGGSTYLALLLLLGISHQVAPQIALVCNLLVVSSGCYLAWREGVLPFQRILPFIIGSIPAAYLAGRIIVPKTLFTVLLAGSLAMVGIRLLLLRQNKIHFRKFSIKQSWMIGLPVGVGLGTLSGLAGIGGGIFLAPLLIFIGWGNTKEVAASASLFILVNSFSGLLGQFSKGFFIQEMPWVFPLLGAVLLGGQLGSRIAFHRLPSQWMVRVTAILVLMVSAQLIFKFL